MVSFTCLPQKHESKAFIFLLDETEMAQNNSIFVWKASNYNRGRSNLRNTMNQVTNLWYAKKSLSLPSLTVATGNLVNLGKTSKIKNEFLASYSKQNFW